MQDGEVGCVAMMAGHTGAGMFGVEHRVGHELAEVVIVEAVKK